MYSELRQGRIEEEVEERKKEVNSFSLNYVSLLRHKKTHSHARDDDEEEQSSPDEPDLLNLGPHPADLNDDAQAIFSTLFAVYILQNVVSLSRSEILTSLDWRECFLIWQVQKSWR